LGKKEKKEKREREREFKRERREMWTWRRANVGRLCKGLLVQGETIVRREECKDLFACNHPIHVFIVILVH